MDEIVWHGRRPGGEAVGHIVIGRSPERIIVDVIHVRIVFEPRSPRVLDIVEEVGTDRVAAEAPVAPGRLACQCAAPAADLVRVTDLKAGMMEADARGLGE